MKNNLLIIVLLFALTDIVTAQPPAPPAAERLEAARVAFFTRHMELSPQEARVFWPIYEAYREKMDEHRQLRRKQMLPDREEFDRMSDADINKMIDERLAIAESALKARKDLINQLRKELSPRKAAMFLRAEDEFQREIVGRLRSQDDRPLPPRRRL